MVATMAVVPTEMWVPALEERATEVAAKVVATVAAMEVAACGRMCKPCICNGRSWRRHY